MTSLEPPPPDDPHTQHYGSTSMLEEVYSHLGQMRYRSEVVEYLLEPMEGKVEELGLVAVGDPLTLPVTITPAHTKAPHSCKVLRGLLLPQVGAPGLSSGRLRRPRSPTLASFAPGRTYGSVGGLWPSTSRLVPRLNPGALSRGTLPHTTNGPATEIAEPLKSGRPDSNRGPPAPKAGALPDCATPRTTYLPTT
jgi:hypothetical protein